MTKQQDWKRVTYLRGIIKNRRSQITKDRHGNTKGGVVLNDETIKPFVAKLKALEEKLAKDKEKMTTNERVDDAADHINAHNDANTDKIMVEVKREFGKRELHFKDTLPKEKVWEVLVREWS
jgi:hypothetical protein